MADPIICGSGLHSNRTICAVMRYIDDFVAKSEVARDDANADLEELSDVVSGIAESMNGINYAPGTGSIAVDYHAPSAPDFSNKGPDVPTFPDAPTEEAPTIDAAPVIPAAYVVPTADTPLIGTTVLDAIFARKQARLSRQGVKAERDATYEAARLGIGGSTAALNLRLQEAQEKTRRDVSEVAGDQVEKEGEWLRLDVEKLHRMHIDHDLKRPELELKSYEAEEGLEVEAYKANFQGFAAITAGLAGVFDAQVKFALGYLGAESDRLRALVASETERRGWTTLESQNALTEAESLTKWAIEKTKYISEIMRETQQAKSALLTGYLQALLSNASVHLSGSGGQSVSE